MSEKRFFKSHYTEHIIDKANDKCYPIRNVMGVDDLVDLLNSLSEENEQLKQSNDRFADTVAKQVSLLIELRKENEQLRQFINKGRRLSVKELMDNINENELLKRKIRGLEKENEELKRERDDWKSSTCSYMNKDSVLSMDCQIVQEALWELEKEIEFGSKREDLFFDLKEKFEKLNNHRIGVFE